MIQEPLIILDLVLIFLISMVALVGLKERESVNIYIFCLFSLMFNVIGDRIPAEYGSFYYIGAAATDLSIIYILSKLFRISQITIKIQQVCKLFITVNFIGWIMFMMYESPIYYNALCTILYLYTLSTTTITGVNNAMGDNAMDGGIFSVFSHTHSVSNITPPNQKEARN
jgi:hypothetical protein